MRIRKAVREGLLHLRFGTRPTETTGESLIDDSAIRARDYIAEMSQPSAYCGECGQPQVGPHLGTCSQSLMRGGPGYGALGGDAYPHAAVEQTAHVVSNGTGGVIDSVWTDQTRADERADALNANATMTLAWSVTTTTLVA